MNTMTNIVLIRGSHARVESVLPSYPRTWKQRPVGPALAGFSGTDNSTGVSEVEYRHR